MKKLTALILAFALPVPACGGDLNIGDGPGNDSGVGSVGTCSASDCSAYKITCSSGQPTNLQCVPDNNIMGCTLIGQCSDQAAAQTCTYTPPPACSGSGPCSAIGGLGNNGEIDVISDPTTMTTTMSVSFAGPTAQTIGSCQYEPYGLGEPGYAVGQPLPNEGAVTATATGFSLSDAPLCDGSYPDATTTELLDQGAVVSFDWVGTSNESKPTFPAIPGPHAVSVDLSAAVTTGSSLSRANDIALTWTPLETPLSLEQVGFELVQASKRLECRFTASANAGTVPADALLQFASGSVQFRMFSLHASPSSGGFVSPTFFVMRQATLATDGSAVKGTLTLQ